MDRIMKQLGLIRGLLENASDAEQLKKALSETLGALELIAEKMSDMQRDHQELSDYVDMMDEDLNELQDTVDDELDMLNDDWDDEGEDDMSFLDEDDEEPDEDEGEDEPPTKEEEKPNGNPFSLWKKDDND